jgi:hypothetical protein
MGVQCLLLCILMVLLATAAGQGFFQDQLKDAKKNTPALPAVPTVISNVAAVLPGTKDIQRTGKQVDAAIDDIRGAADRVDRFGTQLDQVGAVFDEAKAAAADPSGTIRSAVIAQAKTMGADVIDALAKVSDVVKI